MELFDDLVLRTATGRWLPRAWPDADTPLGTLIPSIDIEGEPVTNSLPAELRAPSPGVTHYLWYGSVARCELLRLDLDPDGTRGVDRAVAYVWRLATWWPIEELKLACRWQEEPSAVWSRPHADRFDIGIWSSPHAVVALGTEDRQRLAHRAAANNGLPSRLAGREASVSVTTTPAGAAVTIHDLDRHEHCQIQFVAAWGPPGAAAPVREATQKEPRTLFAFATAGNHPGRR